MQRRASIVCGATSASVGQPDSVQLPQFVRTGSSPGSSAELRMAPRPPTAEPAATVSQQVRVLAAADPAKPCSRRQGALGQRPIIDVGGGAGRQPARAQVGRHRLEDGAAGRRDSRR